MFLGMTFCGGKYSLDYTPIDVSNIKSVTMKNGIYDDLYISKNIKRDYETNIPNEWDFNTILYATFKNNLNAGNLDYLLSEISSIRIKRRKKNTFDWICLYEIPISSRDDAKFEKFDSYCRSDIEYEYALVPVINGVEGNININSVLSKFDGIFIIEKECAFKTILEVEIQAQKNRKSNIVPTIDRKYPFVVSNGQNNYYSGSVSGVFIEEDYINYEWKTKEGWQYREKLMEFLQNGKIKILKNDDGRMWMIAIVDNPSENEEGHWEKIRTTFKWVETGDCESSYDLYDNDFIDVDLGV